MTVIERKYKCTRCAGTGEIESSDSTEDGWWDCRTCEGTGKLADRRRPDPRLAGAVDLLREMVEPQTEPCRYDHHDYCQAHWLHERPCPVERARALLGGQ